MSVSRLQLIGSVCSIGNTVVITTLYVVGVDPSGQVYGPGGLVVFGLSIVLFLLV